MSKDKVRLLQLLREKERRKHEFSIDDPRMCDKWWRLNNLYYIIDEKGNKIKFEPKNRDVQKDLYENLHTCNIILKARQHGVTTFFCIFFLDAALFEPNIRAGIIAHNRDDAESFFNDKVKYAFDNLACPELRDKMSVRKDNARELIFANNSALRVGTSLRSATLQYLLISEYGKICAKYPDKAKEIRTGALNTVHAGQFIAIESTAEGTGGHFYDLNKESRDKITQGIPLTEMDFKPFFYSWFQKPEYQIDPKGVIIDKTMHEYFKVLHTKHGIKLNPAQQAWYVKKYATQQDEMKREFPSTPEEAFEAAIEGAYYARQMAAVRDQGRIGMFPHNPAKEVHTAWDLGINDEMTVWSFQFDGDMVNVIDYYENSGEALSHYVGYLRDKKGWVFGTHFAPHDISKRDLLSGKTRLQRAREDLDFYFRRVSRTSSIIDDINECRRLFFKFRFNAQTCELGIKALDNYRKEWDEKLACFKRTPLHNWASNGADGFRTMIHGVQELTDYSDVREMERIANFDNRQGRSVHGGY